MRRILIIIAGIIVVLGAAIGIYLIFFANSDGLTVGPSGSPFGSAEDRTDGLGQAIDVGVPVQGAGTLYAPRLLRLSDAPVSHGAFALYIPAQTTTVGTTTASGTPPEVITTPEEVEARYIDRQSGNVYSFRIHERTMTRISNKTLPGIQEAIWSSDGSRAFVRFLEADTDASEHISTFSLPIDGEGGYFLERDIAQVAVQGSSTLIMLQNTEGSNVSLAGADGTGSRSLFFSTIRNLTMAIAGSNFVATTKAAAILDGYAFLVDRAGSFTRLLGPLPGLSTLPNPAGTKVMYSYNDRSTLVSQVLDVTNRSTVPLPLATLPEKCVWSRDGLALYCAVPTTLGANLPDDWYQGARSFSDRVWKVDLDTRVASLVFDPAQLADIAMDMDALTLDSASDVLLFRNRIDGSLWSYDL